MAVAAASCRKGPKPHARGTGLRHWGGAGSGRLEATDPGGRLVSMASFWDEGPAVRLPANGELIFLGVGRTRCRSVAQQQRTPAKQARSQASGRKPLTQSGTAGILQVVRSPRNDEMTRPASPLRQRERNCDRLMQTYRSLARKPLHDRRLIWFRHKPTMRLSNARQTLSLIRPGTPGYRRQGPPESRQDDAGFHLQTAPQSAIPAMPIQHRASPARSDRAALTDSICRAPSQGRWFLECPNPR